jgi:protocatechuate 3,4-dioxygenase beta subunit
VRRLSIAIVMALMATVALSATAFADPSTGTVSGHLTDGGAPVSGTSALLFDLNFNSVATTATDSTGAFSFLDIAPGSYKVGFFLPGFIQQFVHHALSFEQADQIAVAAGETATVEETVIPHGSLQGRVTNADGTAFASPYVVARTTDFSVFAQTNGDFDGNYSLPILPAGTYVVSFRRDFSSPVQFARGKIDEAAADPIEITVGATTVLDETFLSTGAIAGHFTRGGTPLAGAFLTMHGLNGTFGTATTGPDGGFRIEAFPGDYRLSFQYNGIEQWARGKRTFADADILSVTAGVDTIVEEEGLPVGTVAGRLLGADGNPVARALVEVADATSSIGGFTDEDGRYAVEVPAGPYRVSFSLDFHGKQWAFGQSTAGTADTITVVANETVVVDDVLRPYGSVTVTARDATTHAPLQSFCANVQGAANGGCTEDGTVTVPDILPGRYLVDAFDGEPYLDNFVPGVIVTSGATTAVVVDLMRGGTISTTVKDAKTGAPVAGVCVEAVEPTRPAGLGNGQIMNCTDETGHVTVHSVTPGTYNLFAWANDGVHGHQWVGPSGGTGAQASARLVTVGPGRSVTVAAIKLDRAGTVNGVITDAATGVPLPNAAAGISSYSDGNGPTQAQTLTDASGHYTYPGLGPYKWTFFFREYGHAAQFSGGTPNRFLATGIRVRAGQTTDYNISLRAGTRLAVTVLGPQGQPIESARITVVNALSGDLMGSADCLGAQRCVIPVLGPQLVKLVYFGFVHGEQYSGYVGGSDFQHASVFLVPGSGTRQLTVRMTEFAP